MGHGRGLDRSQAVGGNEEFGDVGERSSDDTRKAGPWFRAASKVLAPVTFNGDPFEDMETAKRLIAQHPNLDLASVIAVAADKAQPGSARIAAIHTLCFADDHGLSRDVLTRILNDTAEPNDVKDHGAEALCDMRT